MALDDGSAATPPLGEGLAGKWPSLAVILVAQFAAMAVWFASAAAASALARSAPLNGFEAAMLTSAVQAGFVIGTLMSAMLGLPDRYDPRRLFMVSAIAAGCASGILAALPPHGMTIPGLRFLTGIALAGVYPIGMRLAPGFVLVCRPFARPDEPKNQQARLTP